MSLVQWVKQPMLASKRRYQWWYLDGLFQTETAWVVFSFHVSTQSMMALSKKEKPAYRLTLATQAKGTVEADMQVLLSEKVYCASVTRSAWGLRFPQGALLWDKTQYQLQLDTPTVRFQLRRVLPMYVPPAAVFYRAIQMQQVQLVPEGEATLWYDNAVYQGRGYMETVMGNWPNVFCLKDWFWMRVHTPTLCIVMAYANTNVSCFFQPMSFIEVWHHGRLCLSVRNALQTAQFQQFALQHEGIELQLEIQSSHHLQNYSPFERLGTAWGRCLSRYVQGRCLRSMVHVCVRMRGHAQDADPVEWDGMAIAERRAFYGYRGDR
jgi:hypothetical protein